jgi:hypothetical protein
MVSADPGRRPHQPPRDCPVCGGQLMLTRLGCQSCGTELSGMFEPCEFCGLGQDDRELLRVFLASRGNMKELERHLGVSYPTARARLDGVLGRLGLSSPAPAPEPRNRLDVLEALARGEVDVDEAQHQLASLANQ